MKATMRFIMPIMLILVSASTGWFARGLSDDLSTQVITEAAATTEHLDWGTFITYTPEQGTTTYGTQNMLTGTAIINPGMEIHPPHQHSAEEFLYVVEGSGTWSVQGEEVEATAGDLLYAYPWEWHGITNTGDTPLKFFVVKWDNKGVPLPVKER